MSETNKMVLEAAVALKVVVRLLLEKGVIEGHELLIKANALDVWNPDGADDIEIGAATFLRSMLD